MDLQKKKLIIATVSREYINKGIKSDSDSDSDSVHSFCSIGVHSRNLRVQSCAKNLNMSSENKNDILIINIYNDTQNNNNNKTDQFEHI